MTYQTHAYLGSELFPVICETWNVTLSKKKFIEGSIKPDMNSLFLRHPHFWRYSIKYVLRKIDALSRTRLVDGKKNKKFSEDLGIVLHYVADFFTAAHNIKPNKIRSHLAYETKLHEEFLLTINAGSIRNSLLMLDSSSGCSLNSPEQLLHELHNKYKPSKTAPMNDIREIVIACLSVTAYIMNCATASGGQGLNVPEKSTDRFLWQGKSSFQNT